MPSDAILRSSTQTPTCSRSSPATALIPSVGERLDQDALEVVRVLAQILAVVAQVEDRVADELARDRATSSARRDRRAATSQPSAR